MAPRPSQEMSNLSLINEAAQMAVRSEMLAQGSSTDRCRQELDALRGEVSSQVGSLRNELREFFNTMSGRMDTIGKALSAQELTQALINQRLDFKEDEAERAALMRKGTERTPLNNRRLTDRTERYPTPSSVPYRPEVLANPEKDKGPLIKVSPKVWNALILSVVAAAGGTIWHFTEHWLWPREEKAPTVHEAVADPGTETRR